MTDTRLIYRCDRCGALTYPVQHADGRQDAETPDETTIPDKCAPGHRWMLGRWESWGYRGTRAG